MLGRLMTAHTQAPASSADTLLSLVFFFAASHCSQESFKRYFSRAPNEKNRSEFDRYQRYFNHWQRRVTQVLCSALGNSASLAIGEDGKGEAYSPDDNTKIAAVRTIFEIAVESGEQREARRCVPSHREYVQALVDSMGLLIPPKTEKLNAFQVRPPLSPRSALFASDLDSLPGKRRLGS